MDFDKVKTARGRRPLKAAAAVRGAIRERGVQAGNITAFYGAKVKRDWVLPSDIQLAVTVFMEASQDIAWYTADPDEIVRRLDDERVECSKPDILFQRVRGQRGLIEAKWTDDIASDERAKKQQRIQAEAAKACGYTWGWFTENDAQEHRTLLMNWLPVSALLDRYRSMEMELLQEQMARGVSAGHVSTVADVFAVYAEMPATHVATALYRAHQRRLLTVDVSSRDLTARTVVRPWRDQK